MKFLILRILSNVLILFGFYNIYKKFLTKKDQWESANDLNFSTFHNRSSSETESIYKIYDVMNYNEPLSEILDKLRVRKLTNNFFKFSKLYSLKFSKLILHFLLL